MNGQLSNTLRITNINDFLAPSNACVLPMEGAAIPAGSVLTPIIPATSRLSSQPSDSTATSLAADSNELTDGNSAKVATVTVSDCLACSGCVTSSETVLLSSANLNVVRAFAHARRRRQTSPCAPIASERSTDTNHSASSDITTEKDTDSDKSARDDAIAVAILSQQAVASIATRHNLSLSAAAKKLATFLRTVAHFDVVVDQSLATYISLQQAAEEFLARHAAGQRPTITSACPGWVTYAEKTQPPAVLSTISAIRSPQAIAASLVYDQFATGRNGDENAQGRRNLWIVAVAQCHDKKLEAIRPEFVRKNGHPEIDCVITAAELCEFMQDFSFHLVPSRESPLDSLAHPGTTTETFGVSLGSGSDGYACHILHTAAKQLLKVDIPANRITFEKVSKSGDVRIASISSLSGSTTLRFATAYGFRSLQSMLRKLRNGTCPYDYIELMACPGGCNNGGGQLSPPLPMHGDSRTAKQISSEHLQEVEKTFYNAPLVDECEARAAVGMVEQGVTRRNDEDVDADTRLPSRLRIVSRKESKDFVASLDW